MIVSSALLRLLYTFSFSSSAQPQRRRHPTRRPSEVAQHGALQRSPNTAPAYGSAPSDLGEGEGALTTARTPRRLAPTTALPSLRAATLPRSAPPAPGFGAVRVEGYCAPAPPAGGEAVALALWTRTEASGARVFVTCAGNPACASGAAAAGYTVANASMCWGYNATTVEQLPCLFGCNSVERRDDSFFENDYWRGRIWGPQVALVWMALQRYDAVPEARAARGVLVRQALRLELQDWRLFRQVNENHNGCVQSAGGARRSVCARHWKWPCNNTRVVHRGSRVETR